MSRFLLLFPIALLIVACQGESSAPPPPPALQADLPNVVLIIADDLGYGDLNQFGQEGFRTPFLSQMAREGMTFTNFYAGSTVCAPSRASLMTGRHTGHSSVRGNVAGQLLREEEITLAEVFRDAGYATGIMGKWGIGHPPAANDPAQHGFEEHYGYVNMWHAHNFYPEFLYRNGEKEALAGNQLQTATDGSNPWASLPEGTGVAAVKETYAPYEIELAAYNFIAQHQDQPFFLMLSLNQPHANNEAMPNGLEVPAYSPRVSDDWPEAEKGFVTMVQHIDTVVGRMLGQIDQLGLDNQTLVMFTSDNGPHQEGGHKVEFFDSNGPLRGKKRDLYEGGIRVPLIVRWPGMVPVQRQMGSPYAFWDLLPTMAELTGNFPPSGYSLDGVSMLPTIIGNSMAQQRHTYLYWEFYEQGGKQAVRWNNWKGIRQNVAELGKQAELELYDLARDIGETQNVADQHPEVVQQILDYMEEAHTPMADYPLFPTGP